MEGQPAPAFVMVNSNDAAFVKVVLDPVSSAFAVLHLGQKERIFL